MKFRRKHRFAAEVSTSSLNDIMFFLLLFFLIISTVSNPNVLKVMLPKASSQEVLSKKQIALTVSQEKRYYIDSREIYATQLEAELQRQFTGIDNATLVLRLDHSLNIQDLVDLLAVGKKLKIKMVIATEKAK